MKSRYNPLLVFVIAVGLCFSLWLNLVRNDVEQKNNTVEMAMEYEGLDNLAKWEGLNLSEVLNQFKSAGITSLIVFDTTLEKLNHSGEVFSVTGNELLINAGLGEEKAVFKPLLREGKIIPDAVYITQGSSQNAFNEVLEDLYLRYDKQRIRIVQQEPQIIEVLGNPMVITEENYDTKPGVMQASLGLSSSEMQRISKAGFNIIIRPQNYLPVNADNIGSIFKRIDKSGANVTAYIGSGREIVGYPNNLSDMAEKLKEYKINFGMVEHYTQLQFAPLDGVYTLAEEMDYRVARAYIIDKLEQRKLKMPEALRRWALTDEERNIRINYIKPFMVPQNGQDILELNVAYVKQIAESVKDRGFKLGPATVFRSDSGEAYASYFPEKWLYLPIAWAILAGGVIYLSLLLELRKRKQYLLLIIGGIIVSFILLNFQGMLTRQILALTAATVFPVLSMTVIVELWNKRGTVKSSVWQIMGKTTLELAFAVLMSLVGASLLGAILSDSRFFLEIDIYRGVKITFILPVLLITIWYARRFRVLSQNLGGQFMAGVKNLFRASITVKHVMILGVLAFIAYIFVGRSGHTGGVPVPAIELKMRAFLEQVMYARPREKEFMIGHPAFYMAALATYHKTPRLWQMALVVAATIGQGSLVQTFAHMRTPIFMSYMRALDGYVVGVGVGIVGIVVVSALLPYLKKWQRRYLEQ